MMGIVQCKNCDFWSFKVECNGESFGQCKFGAVTDKMRISIARCDIYPLSRKEIFDYAAIQTRDDFGCIFGEEKKKET